MTQKRWTDPTDAAGFDLAPVKPVCLDPVFDDLTFNDFICADYTKAGANWCETKFTHMSRPDLAPASAYGKVRP